MSAIAVVGYGRMNPVTKGHRYLAQQLKNEADKRGGDAILYLSRSYDGKLSGKGKRKIRNPLPYDDKLRYVQEALGDLVDVRYSELTSVFDIFTELSEAGYHELVILGDEAFLARSFEDYNGDLFHFRSIEKVAAGVRDESSSDFIESVSATRARAAVAANDFGEFRALAATHGLTQKMWLQLKAELLH